MLINANTLDVESFFLKFWRIVWLDAAPLCKYLTVGFLALTIYYIIFGKGIERRFFGIQSLILVLFLFNPYCMYYISLWWGLSSRYFRYLWITPILLTYGYFIAQVVLCKQSRFRITVAYLLAFIMLIISGYELKADTSKLYTSVEINTGMKSVDNIYKIEQDTLDIVTIIENDKRDSNQMVKALYGYYIFMDIRTYDASIYCDFSLSQQNKYLSVTITQELVDELTQEGQENNLLAMMVNVSSARNKTTVEISQEVVYNALKVKEIEYIVVQADSPYSDVFKKCGEVMGTTKNFTVVKVI
jgi:hypothetical protein